MVHNFKIMEIGLLLVYCFYSLVQIKAVELEQELDIQADSGDINLQTSISRLHGNILLKHKTFTIAGDDAEIQAANDTRPQLCIISGTPVTFNQQSKISKTIATSLQLVYTPDEEIMELQGKVSFIQYAENTQYTLQADELQIVFSQGHAQQMLTKGSPTVFSHKTADKKIEIQAQMITWDTEAQEAILHHATVLDEQTTFSAEKITYNTITGELSASGEGNTRPSYRYSPEKTKEINNNNDTKN